MAKKTTSSGSDYGTLFTASKSASTLLVLFIPSRDRHAKAIDQVYWRNEALAVLGRRFGGATAYPQGMGVWRDDERGGQLLFDEFHRDPVLYVWGRDRRQAGALREFLIRMGTECRQRAVGFVIDRDYLEIRFPLVLL